MTPLLFLFATHTYPFIEKGGMTMKIIKFILKLILITIVLGLATWVLKSIFNFFKNRRRKS